MSGKLRFAKEVAPPNADAMASPSLVRALVRHLVESHRLHPDEVERIREHAIEELTVCSEHPAVGSARMLVLHEFP